MNVGDAFAFSMTLTVEPNSRDLLVCDISDERVIFSDKFYDSRGQTPTSVIQWSKGTIFVTHHIDKGST